MVTEIPEASVRRNWHRVAALAVLTAFGVYLCYQLTVPFLPGVAWAVALAVIGFPLHRLVVRVVPNRNWAAGISTAIVTLGIALPTAWVAGQLTTETTHAVNVARDQAETGHWRDYAARAPYFGDAIARLDIAEVEAQIRQTASQVASISFGMIRTVTGGLLQAMVAVFVLFFCFRDHHHLRDDVRALLPLAPPAADRIMKRAGDAIHATVYGTLVTAVIQAVTGGLLFWALGIPGAVLWGVVMFILGILPFVGAILVWAPAAVFLASDERWGAALALVAWGVLMAGPIGNYVYAAAAGDRLRLHPVPTLIAYAGGLAVFGISGMVLGPCILAVTVALLDVWRQRSADGVPLAAQSPDPVKT